MEVGDRVRLKGKTLRGKNRIRRGGEIWLVIEKRSSLGLLMESCRNNLDLFWMLDRTSDPNMEVVEDGIQR